MRYISTRGGIDPISFTDAVMMGLATDGGLLLPEAIPDMHDRLAGLQSLPYPRLAVEIIREFVGDDIADDDLTDLITRSYVTFDHPEVAPIVPVGNVFILELFHGPTLAFKDFALQFLGNVFEYILTRQHRRLNILGVTSGDTGSAAIHGVRGKANINIFIIHPHQRISQVQERQMTSVLDENVFNIAIEGSFDDGQRIMKELFTDLEFKENFVLGAVNSVNWARIAAQIVYYFFAACRVCKSTGRERVQISVPTGNFGDIFAGYMALKMGAPIARLILATNDNDILARFFRTGVYAAGNVVSTLSPSMDIQVASNFERYLYHLLNRNPRRLTLAMEKFAETGEFSVPSASPNDVDPIFRAGVGDTDATLSIIRRYFEGHGYVLDPHTAVGAVVAEKFRDPDLPTICLATAHPAKFSESVTRATGRYVARHDSIDSLADLPTRLDVLPADRNAVRDYMMKKLG